MMGDILTVKGLCKSYQDFSLSDISFMVPEDCIAGFIGINGAGKTTTIRTILGLAQKDGGTIGVFGKDMARYEQALKDRIGVVLEEGCFYDALTMDEMKSVLSPAYSHWSEKDYKQYMNRFSLNPRQKIATLSKGMRVKFALVLALSHGADLLIMDEPNSGLDPLVRRDLLAIIRDYMKQGGKGVLFSTHIISDLDKVADMLILIHEGKILFERDKDALLDAHRLVKGDARFLNDQTKKLFLHIQTTDFGFTGITSQVEEVQRRIPDILVERPSIEDIMLGHIGGE